MLDIVVYENKKDFISKNIDNIDMSNYDVNYYNFDSMCYEFESLIKSRDRKKIYILDDEVDGVSGLEVAIKIREYDWDSIIILLIDLSKHVSDVFNERIMALDIIFKDNSSDDRLIDDIKLAISIFAKQTFFTFKYNHTIYRIPYRDICYIEKESAVKRCIIHTMDGNYYITESVSSILSHLSSSFCRIHQSCIVNFDNVRKYNLSTNMIVFNNGDMTDMISSKMKNVVKNYVGISK